MAIVSRKRPGNVLLTAILSTSGAALICVAMVASSLHAEQSGAFSRADELMDWGSLKASQEMAQYNDAYQLGGSGTGGIVKAAGGVDVDNVQTEMAKGASAEMQHISALTDRMFPKEAEHARRGGKKATAETMLSHWGKLNKEVFPKEANHDDKERESSAQELAHLKKLSSDVWPSSKARKSRGGNTAQAMLSHYSAINKAIFPSTKAAKGHKKMTAKESSAQELSHFAAIGNAVFPAEKARKRVVQTSQGMLARYAKLNALVFPSDKAAKKHRVQDV